MFIHAQNFQKEAENSKMTPFCLFGYSFPGIYLMSMFAVTEITNVTEIMNDFPDITFISKQRLAIPGSAHLRYYT